MEKLDFAKYYDVTEIAKKHSPTNYNEYEKIFVCVDTLDFWIVRIQKGWRNDEEEGYVEDENNWLLERNNIGKPSKAHGVEKMSDLTWIFDEDGLDNWDVSNCDSLEETEELIDAGYGLEKLDINGNKI
jgi:hypothetical protein